jgi:hypothetical protein
MGLARSGRELLAPRERARLIRGWQLATLARIVGNVLGGLPWPGVPCLAWPPMAWVLSFPAPFLSVTLSFLLSSFSPCYHQPRGQLWSSCTFYTVRTYHIPSSAPAHHLPPLQKRYCRYAHIIRPLTNHNTSSAALLGEGGRVDRSAGSNDLQPFGRRRQSLWPEFWLGILISTSGYSRNASDILRKAGNGEAERCKG